MNENHGSIPPEKSRERTSKIEIIVLVLAVALPSLNILRFVLMSRWLDRLNKGLPPEEQFQMIGWWGFDENRRAWERWRQIRGNQLPKK